MSQVQAIIIVAAYTNVDLAEDDEDTAMAVNAIAPGVIARWAFEKGIPVIYISTDYVFSGKATQPYKTNAQVDPINIYGRSKYLGEQAVSELQPFSTILRTSWVYDGVGKNFLMKILKLAETRKVLNIVNDQLGRPTYASHLAEIVLLMAVGLASRDKRFTGIFHVSGGGETTSWAGFACEVFSVFAPEMQHKVEVKGVPSSQFPSRVKRPKYSVLDTSKIELLLGQSMPDWQLGVKEARKEGLLNVHKGVIRIL